MAGRPTGTPSTKLNCIGSPGTLPLAAIRRMVSRCPISKHSYSGLILFIIRLPKARIIGIVFSNTSSPKLQVPQSSVAIWEEFGRLQASFGCHTDGSACRRYQYYIGADLTHGVDTHFEAFFALRWRPSPIERVYEPRLHRVVSRFGFTHNLFDRVRYGGLCLSILHRSGGYYQFIHNLLNA